MSISEREKEMEQAIDIYRKKSSDLEEVNKFLTEKLHQYEQDFEKIHQRGVQ